MERSIKAEGNGWTVLQKQMIGFYIVLGHFDSYPEAQAFIYSEEADAESKRITGD